MPNIPVHFGTDVHFRPHKKRINLVIPDYLTVG
jgi:hypothetical protein